MLTTRSSQPYFGDILAALGSVLVIVNLITELRARTKALTSAEVCELISAAPGDAKGLDTFEPHTRVQGGSRIPIRSLKDC